MSLIELRATDVKFEPGTVAPEIIEPSQTVAETFDMAAVTELTTKAIDLAQTVTSLPLIG